MDITDYYKQILKDYEFATEETLFECVKCGKCCGEFRLEATLSENDVKRMYAVNPELVNGVTTSFSKFSDDLVITTMNDSERGCTFLKDNKCELHGIAKPLACQLYPFILALPKTVVKMGLKPPENAVMVSIPFMGEIYRGYIIYDPNCEGINPKGGRGERVNFEQIAELSLRYAFELTETSKIDIIGFLNSLQDKSRIRLQIVKDFFEKARVTEVQIPLSQQGPKLSVEGLIAYDPLTIGDKYAPIISSLAPLLAQNLSLYKASLLTAIFALVEGERMGEGEEEGVDSGEDEEFKLKLKEIKSMIFGTFYMVKEGDTVIKLCNGCLPTAEQLVTLVNAAAMSEPFREKRNIRFIRMIIPVDKNNNPILKPSINTG